MQRFSISPIDMFATHWRNRELIKVSVQREILGRYRGSMLGVLWSFFNPLFMLVVYTFVFSEVFKTRWSAESQSKTEFALILFAGLVVFNIFAECINRAPGLIVSNVNYVKKVKFPLEILPSVVVLSSLFHLLVSVCVWVMAYAILFGVPKASVLFFPFIIFPFSFLILGLSWFLASLGVYLRDVTQFIGIVVSVLMFLSPIFYPVTALPESYRYLLNLNPLTPVIGLVRDSLYWGRPPDLFTLGITSLFSVLVAWVGYVWFQKTRKGFADVL